MELIDVIPVLPIAPVPARLAATEQNNRGFLSPHKAPLEFCTFIAARSALTC